MAKVTSKQPTANYLTIPTPSLQSSQQTALTSKQARPVQHTKVFGLLVKPMQMHYMKLGNTVLRKRNEVLGPITITILIPAYEVIVGSYTHYS